MIFKTLLLYCYIYPPPPNLVHIFTSVVKSFIRYSSRDSDFHNIRRHKLPSVVQLVGNSEKKNQNLIEVAVPLSTCCHITLIPWYIDFKKFHTCMKHL